MGTWQQTTLGTPGLTSLIRTVHEASAATSHLTCRQNIAAFFLTTKDTKRPQNKRTIFLASRAADAEVGPDAARGNPRCQRTRLAGRAVVDCGFEQDNDNDNDYDNDNEFQQAGRQAGNDLNPYKLRPLAMKFMRSRPTVRLNAGICGTPGNFVNQSG